MATVVLQAATPFGVAAWLSERGRRDRAPARVGYS
jgi:hypothetical protein